MRKLLFFFLTLTCVQITVGQEWSILVGADSKALQYNKKKSVMARNPGYIGHLNGTAYIMGFYDELLPKAYLAAYDGDLKELRKTDLPSEPNQSLYGGFANEKSIDLLMTQKGSSSYTAYKISYDPATLEKLGEPVDLVTFSRGTSDKTYTYVSSSQSQEWLSLIFAVVDDGNVEWLVGLYDTELEELWSMEFRQDAIDDYFVTDSGEVVVAGFYEKKNSDETRLQFAILDGEREQSYTCNEVLPQIRNMEIVRYEDGKIYCTGMLVGESQDGKDTWNSGFYSLVYDTRAKRMTKFEKVDFTKENICDLCNASRNLKLKILSTDKIRFADSHYDNDGTTVLYERTYNYFLDGIFIHSEYVGILAYRIDKQGHIEWHKVLMRDIQAPNGIDNNVRTKLTPAGDAYTIFYMDLPVNVGAKDGKTVPVAPLERSKLGLMATTIDHQGNVKRSMLTVPPKSVTVGAPHPLDDGSYMLLLARPFNSNIGILNYK